MGDCQHIWKLGDKKGMICGRNCQNGVRCARHKIRSLVDESLLEMDERDAVKQLQFRLDRLKKELEHIKDTAKKLKSDVAKLTGPLAHFAFFG